MSIITRYILKEYLKIFFITLAALVLVYLSIEFFQKMRRFAEQGAQFIWVFQYFIYRLPKIIFDIVPLAILLSTLLTLGGFSKNNEIVALKSSGVGILRVAAPLLILGAAMSVFLYFLNGSLIPSAFKKARTLQEVQIEKKNRRGNFIQNKVWLRLDSRTIFNIELIDPDKKSMHGINIYFLGVDFSFPEEIEAEGMFYENDEWILLKGIHRKFQSDGDIQVNQFERQTIRLNKKPEDFQQGGADPQEMTYQKLESYIAQLSADGFSPTRFQVDLRGKQAFPFVNFMMVLLAIPFALKDNRSAGIARGVLISITMALFYHLVFAMTISLGRVMVFPPWLAAWSANILMLAIGIYLFLQIRQ